MKQKKNQLGDSEESKGQESKQEIFKSSSGLQKSTKSAKMSLKTVQDVKHKEEFSKEDNYSDMSPEKKLSSILKKKNMSNESKQMSQGNNPSPSSSRVSNNTVDEDDGSKKKANLKHEKIDNFKKFYQNGLISSYNGKNSYEKPGSKQSNLSRIGKSSPIKFQRQPSLISNNKLLNGEQLFFPFGSAQFSDILNHFPLYPNLPDFNSGFNINGEKKKNEKNEKESPSILDPSFQGIPENSSFCKVEGMENDVRNDLFKFDNARKQSEANPNGIGVPNLVPSTSRNDISELIKSSQTFHQICSNFSSKSSIHQKGFLISSYFYFNVNSYYEAFIEKKRNQAFHLGFEPHDVKLSVHVHKIRKNFNFIHRQEPCEEWLDFYLDSLQSNQKDPVFIKTRYLSQLQTSKRRIFTFFNFQRNRAVFKILRQQEKEVNNFDSKKIISLSTKNVSPKKNKLSVSKLSCETDSSTRPNLFSRYSFAFFV